MIFDRLLSWSLLGWPMTSYSHGDRSFGASRLRLATIVGLRWIAVVGQLVALLTVYFFLGFDLPIGLCLVAIFMSVMVNVALKIKNPPTLRLRAPHAAWMLTYDTLQLSVLLFLTGGIQNPFSFLMMVPATIAAATQPFKNTMAIAAVAVLCVSVMSQFYLPLPWYEPGGLELPALYRVGIWIGMVSSISFMAFYTWRIAQEGREMADALAATEMVLAHEQQLAALDGLAAAAAHELGTPLGTIAVVSKELAREVGPDSRLSEDFDLIRSQAKRCQGILATLAGGGQESDTMFMRVQLPHMLEDVAEPHRLTEVDVSIVCSVLPGTSESGTRVPTFERNPGISYALGNFLENAVDFAESEVKIFAEWGDEEVIIRMEDDGPGFSAQILQGLGEPYLTSRPSTEPVLGSEDHSGLGLGFFIANMFLRRTFATVEWTNKKLPDHGAIITVKWRRDVVDVGDQKV